MGGTSSTLTADTRKFLKLTMDSEEVKTTGKTSFEAACYSMNQQQENEICSLIQQGGFDVVVTDARENVRKFELSKRVTK